jgi:FdhD protein
MQRGIDTREKMLLVTGRISSEMLVKSATMGCPIVASRNSPTSLSVNLARELGITLIGYVRRHTMRIYSFPERLQGFSGKVSLAADLEIT